MSSEGNFVPLDFGVPTRAEQSCNEQTLSVRRLTFSETYQNASFRCSLFENQTQLVASAEQTLILLPGELCTLHIRPSWFKSKSKKLIYDHSLKKVTLCSIVVYCVIPCK